MKLDRKKLMIIGGVLLAVGIGVYFWRKKSQQDDSVGITKSDEESQKSISPDSDNSTSNTTTSEDKRYSYPVNPLLSKIENKKVASYLSKLLNEKDMYRFRGWMDLINKDRAKDPTKWGDANGLKGEVARVGHALYQMDEQNKKTTSTKGNQVVATRKVWSTQILTDLQDAQ